MRKLIAALAIVALLAAAPIAPADAQAKPRGFIRDAEIETTIRAYATPLFAAAGLDPQSVRVYLVNDDTLNAFVAGGMNLFIYTGLLMRSESANQLIGVIAHETGHIAGGHLARTQEALENATAESILAFVLGIGAAIATGDSGAGAAVIAGGQSIAQRSLLQYSRTQESAADQAALSYLDRTAQSARGMLEFLEVLGGQELLLSNQQDPYLRTHPLSRDRVDTVRNYVSGSPYADAVEPPEFVVAHARMRAKLVGFLRPLGRVLQQYPESDNSLEGRYARAIAYYRAADLKRALPMVDGLISERPDDPFFHELKGQILFENGRAREALPYYEAAVRLQPDAPLLRQGLAQVQLESGDPELNRAALAQLDEVVRIEPHNAGAWRLLSIAYGRDGQLGMTALALAESAGARGDTKEARQQADRALKLLPENSPAWLRAQDIFNAASRDDD
ncbi:MAG: M48 family metalloprotease [Dongiaceae bacterium]